MTTKLSVPRAILDPQIVAEQLTKITLSVGGHSSAVSGMCVMEVSKSIGHPKRKFAARKDVSERFWRMVRSAPTENGCWEWQGTKNNQGYGAFSFERRIVKAHRMAWELTHGAIPPGQGPHGTCVLHKCDNPSCCQPEHLFLGTNQENANDRHQKQRSKNVFQRGSQHVRAKLDESQIREIRMLYAAGWLPREIAAAFSVSRSQVALIVTRKAWTHVA